VIALVTTRGVRLDRGTSAVDTISDV
jgi:hypothetical protein